MRVAQVAPLIESVPPPAYGGTERVVSYLTEELVRQGHEVTLFASGDSVTSAELVPCTPRSLRLDGRAIDPIAHLVAELEAVAKMASRFDVIHWHLDYFHFPISRRLGVPQLTTLHGRLDIPDLQDVFAEFADMPVVSVSNSQRAPLPQAGWIGTVHHGLPADECVPSYRPGDYLAFLGRISPEKRPDRAIDIARRAGLPLRIAAKVDPVDRSYFAEQIEPLLDPAFVDFVGEVAGAGRGEFLAGARGLLFPIDWAEPFGLVMIEALACGTPVVAYRCGSVPEVIDDGKTGFIVDSIESAVQAVHDLDGVSREACRAAFERRFTVERMANDYLALYHRVVAEPPSVAWAPLPVRPRATGAWVPAGVSTPRMGASEDAVSTGPDAMA